MDFEVCRDEEEQISGQLLGQGILDSCWDKWEHPNGFDVLGYFIECFFGHVLLLVYGRSVGVLEIGSTMWCNQYCLVLPLLFHAVIIVFYLYYVVDYLFSH